MRSRTPLPLSRRREVFRGSTRRSCGLLHGTAFPFHVAMPVAGKRLLADMLKADVRHDIDLLAQRPPELAEAIVLAPPFPVNPLAGKEVVVRLSFVVPELTIGICR